MSKLSDEQRSRRAANDAAISEWTNKVYELGLHKLERQLSNDINRARYNNDQTAYNDLMDTYAQRNAEYGWLWRRAARLNLNRHQRTWRLRQRLRSMFETGHSIFITLTFTDEVLERTTPKTRRQMVYRFLKSQCDYYVANRDYGGKNGREHYHAVLRLALHTDKCNPKEWHGGAINFRRIRNNPNDAQKLARYLTKLSMHATKDSTGNSRMIFSRKICDNKQ